MRKTRVGVLTLAGALILAASSAARQRPDFSGGWAATRDTPEGVGAAPTAVFGPRFWLDQKGGTLTVIRPVRETSLTVVHPVDGVEVRSRIPGAMCLGDAGTITSVIWEGNDVVHRIHGSMPPGTDKVVPAAVRHVFRKGGVDRIQVESLTRVAGQPQPVPVATVYARIADAPPPPPTSPPVRTAPATLAKLTWLGGTWAGTQGSASIEERWTPAGGGSMLAVSRTVSSSGAVSAFEFLCIAERAGSLVYTAMPNGRTPATDFMLTAIDDTSATFENPGHDFPKMIRYAVQPDGTLTAAISGAPGSRTTTFTFKKQ